MDKSFQECGKAWRGGAIVGTDLCDESGQQVEVEDALGDMFVGGMSCGGKVFMGAVTVEVEGVPLRWGGVGAEWADSHVVVMVGLW